MFENENTALYITVHTVVRYYSYSAYIGVFVCANNLQSHCNNVKVVYLFSKKDH